MTVGDVFHARVASGEQAAGSLMQVCRDAGIVPLRSKATNAGWKPGETVAVAALERVLTTHGPDVVRPVLAALAQPRHAGAIKAMAIYALTDIVAADRDWLRCDLTRLLSRIRLADLVGEAGSKAKANHQPARQMLRAMLASALVKVRDQETETPKERVAA